MLVRPWAVRHLGGRTALGRRLCKRGELLPSPFGVTERCGPPYHWLAEPAPLRIHSVAGRSLEQGIEVPGLVVTRSRDRPESCRGKGLGRGHTRTARPLCGTGLDRCC